MRSKSGKSSKKKGKKMTEAEREDALVALIVRIIVAQTLKEFYRKNKDSERD
ncbi:hypothetical protein [Flavobacterium sp. CLA17]|uniref:hypothetical protein n=1 Tax=Flavobacterium sp. CLA17 TaxID=2724135 RepID=UPI0014923005|nr:hypothetical protein [Flavobacterium sp. CLA17]QSB28471.1 hypothetical protein HAV12_006970 [Flavobacterium sp. CLA17]